LHKAARADGELTGIDLQQSLVHPGPSQHEQDNPELAPAGADIGVQSPIQEIFVLSKRQHRAMCRPNPIYWRALIPFFHIGWFTIPTFGLMVACAMVAAYFVLRADLVRRGIAPGSASAQAEMFIAIPCVAGIAGAKIYHVLQSPRELFADPLGQIFSGYGFAWFGGLLAGFAAFVWLARRQKIPLLEMLDAGSPAAALGYGIGRIGCLLSGDGDYGVPTSLPWGMRFPDGLVPTNERVHPTPIYEFIVACWIAWWLWRLGSRQLVASSGAGLMPRARKHRVAAKGRATKAGPLPRGCVFAAYLVLTGAARFLVEFIRINPRSFLGMSNAQAASAISVIVGAALCWRLRKGPGAGES
jgi:phosphatidylglycerol:prolipoprotein diacylglycerol transferase